MVRALSFACLAGAAQSADICSLYAISGDSCSESELRCDYTKYAKLAEKSLADGTCADQGYTIETSTSTKTYPIVGDIKVTTYSQGLEADTCSLFAITYGNCFETELRCDYTKYAKLEDKTLADGTCADQGYTIETDTSTTTYPIVGDVKVTVYEQGLEADTCSLFAITGDSCSESELRCDYTKYAKLAEKSLADGTCADQGYTIETSTSTKTYPIVGDIKVTTYSQGMLETKEAETCCVDDACVAPKVKYYSVDLKHGFCGEACMDPAKFGIYKIFEKNLTLSESLNPCSEQFTPFGTHYTEYNDTVTHGLPGVLTVTLDLYGPGPALGAVSV